MYLNSISNYLIIIRQSDEITEIISSLKDPMDRHGSFSVVSTKALHVGYGMGRHAGKPLGIHKMLAENPGKDLQW